MYSIKLYCNESYQITITLETIRIKTFFFNDFNNDI